jgi:DNA-binding PadR family transcriptional regulator
MSELRNGPFSGYDIISYIHNKFQLLVSSGTVYSLLYRLQRNNLVKVSGRKEKEPTNSPKRAPTP